MKLRRLPNPHGWTSLPNAALEDHRLSFRAAGILAYLLSRPDGWETDSVRLAAPGAREGRDAVRTALTQLESVGYLHRVKRRTKAGQIVTEYFVSDHPVDAPIATIIADELDLPDAGDWESGPGSTGGDNAVENGGENPPPTPEKPTPENPAALTSTQEPLDEDAQPQPTSALRASVENDAAPTGGAAPSALAPLAKAEPPALAATDEIPKASRLEPGVQMFALRAHLVAEVGPPLDWHVVRDLVERAHESALPSRRGRLSTADVLQWSRDFWSPPKIDPSRLPAARPSRGLTAAEPAPPAGMEAMPEKDRASADDRDQEAYA